MKHIIIAALLALLGSSCTATRAAQADLEDDLSELRVALADLQHAQATGADAETVAALEARVDTMTGEVRASAEEVKDAVTSDTEGLLGLSEGGMQGGVIGLASAALAWYLRDRRKKLGRDPLQRADIKTPPPTG